MANLKLQTVLVVDDDPVFSFALGGVLRASGYTVLGAAKASEAYSFLESENIDVAIVDLNLPDKSGLELIHDAKRSQRPIRILATTAALSDLHLEISRYLGADSSMRKVDVFKEPARWTAAVDELAAAAGA